MFPMMDMEQFLSTNGLARNANLLVGRIHFLKDRIVDFLNFAEDTCNVSC